MNITLAHLTTPQIVALYNAVTGKAIKGFHTRAKGLDQTTALLVQEPPEMVVEYARKALLPYNQIAELGTAIAFQASAELEKDKANSLEQRRTDDILDPAVVADAEQIIKAPAPDQPQPHGDGPVPEQGGPVDGPKPVPAAQPSTNGKPTPATQPRATGKRGPKPRYFADTDVIAYVAPNPKKPGKNNHARYAKMQVGQTVAEALAAGVTRGDLIWDEQRQFITIVTPGEDE